MAISAGMALLSTATVALGVAAPIFGLGLVGHFLVTTAIGAAINALTPKPSSAAPSGYNVTQTGSALDHQIVYGEAKVAGVRVFDGTTGGSNEFLHRVIAFTGHEIESFEEVYLNDDLLEFGNLVTYEIEIAGDYTRIVGGEEYNYEPAIYSVTVSSIIGTYDVGDELTPSQITTLNTFNRNKTSSRIFNSILPIINVSYWTVGSAGRIISKTESMGALIGPSKYVDYVKINLHTGSPDQSADPDLVDAFEGWTTDHKLSNISYVYVRYQYNQDVFPNGVPELTVTIKGKKVYDPRTGATAWSNNPALCVRDYLTNVYGLNEEIVNIDDTLVISAANVCETVISGLPKYTCNGNFTTGSTPYDVLQYLLSSMGGLLWYAQGKWRMKPAYWTEPVLSLNEDDLRSSISLSTRHSRRDNYNSVNGTFRGPETNWQVTDFPPVTNAAFLEADNNQESSIDLKLQFTDNTKEARRLSRISLERNRQQLTIKASFGLRAFQVQVGDNIRLSLDRFGWVEKEFEVTSWTFGLVDNNDLQVQMVLREISESVFDEVDDGEEYENDNTLLPDPFFVPEIGLNVIPKIQTSNQKVTYIAEVKVTSFAPQFIDYVDIEYKAISESVWKSLGSGPLGIFEIIDIESGEYDFRGRAFNTLGVSGDYYVATNVEISFFNGPPSDVTGFIAEVSGNSLFLKWDAIPDLDLSHYIIKHSPAYSGATWNTSSTLVEKVARPSTSVAVPARAGTYLIKAYDKEGFLSEDTGIYVVLAESIPPLGNIETVTEDPTFAGSKTNILLTSGTIEISDTNTATPTGTYFFANTVDLGSVRNARVTGYTTFTRSYDNGTLLWDGIPQLFDTWPDVFDTWTDETAEFGDVEILVYVSTTNDDPSSGSAVWSAYELAAASFFLGRGFRFKAILNSSNRYYTPNVSELSATVEY
jgi:hypothetical protein